MDSLQTGEAARRQTASDGQTAARQDSPLNTASGPKGERSPSSMDARQIHRELFGTSPSPTDSATSQDAAMNDVTTDATASKPEEQVVFETEDGSGAEGSGNQQALSIRPMTADSAAEDEDVAMQEPEAASTGPATTTQGQDDAVEESEGTSPAVATFQGMMPPPTAPASLLWNTRPSTRALTKPIADLSAFVPLVSTCVILFRQGKAVEASKLAQFTIDIAGQESWNENLATFMAAERMEMDKEPPLQLLHGTIFAMRALEASGEPNAASSADFLEGMLYAWDWI